LVVEGARVAIFAQLIVG
jgi:hypothetical protein